MIAAALSRALAQLGEALIRALLLRALLGTLLLAVLLVVVSGTLLGAYRIVPGPWDAVLDALGVLAALVLAWILYPTMVVVVAGLLVEPIARAVERRHYPDVGAPRQPSLTEVLAAAGRLVVVGLALNLLALPLYLLLPGINLLIYLALNGFLIGREYFEMTAARHLTPAEMSALRARWRRPIWTLGIIGTALLTVPLVNLAAPVFLIMAFVHLSETLRRARGREQPAGSIEKA